MQTSLRSLINGCIIHFLEGIMPSHASCKALILQLVYVAEQTGLNWLETKKTGFSRDWTHGEKRKLLILIPPA